MQLSRTRGLAPTLQEPPPQSIRDALQSAVAQNELAAAGGSGGGNFDARSALRTLGVPEAAIQTFLAGTERAPTNAAELLNTLGVPDDRVKTFLAPVDTSRGPGGFLRMLGVPEERIRAFIAHPDTPQDAAGFLKGLGAPVESVDTLLGTSQPARGGQ